MANKARYIIVEEHQTFIQRMVAVYDLAIELTKADLRSRQFQRMLGPVWWIFEPSMMSLAFYFLTQRMNYSTGENHFLFIFIGTTTWRFFSRCVENSVFLYVGYSPVIRQVLFPLLSTSISLLFTEFIFFCCGLGVIVIVGFFFPGVHLGFSLFVLLLLLLCQSILTLALMILVSCIGVYVRDLQAPLSVTLAVAFFLSPGVYDASRLPARLYWLEYVNPFFYLFPAYRSILMYDTVPNLLPLVGWTAFGVALTGVGLLLYSKIRPNLLRVL